MVRIERIVYIFHYEMEEVIDRGPLIDESRWIHPFSNLPDLPTALLFSLQIHIQASPYFVFSTHSLHVYGYM